MRIRPILYIYSLLVLSLFIFASLASTGRFAFQAVQAESRRLLPPEQGSLGLILKSASIGSPSQYRNLTIYPVFVDGEGKEVSTLDEALRSGDLLVTEVGQGSVQKLEVENAGKRWVYAMAGEILEGAKQDRILQHDLLLPPYSGRVIVAVFCVEHGRWTKVSDRFSSAGVVANLGVRQKAAESKSQQEVWNSAADSSRSLGASAPTGALKEVYKSEKYREYGKDYEGHFSRLPEQSEKPYQDHFSRFPKVASKASGVVVLIQGRIMAADLFGSEETFRRLWPKLLRSYVAEAVSRNGGSDPEEKRRWVQEDPASFLAEAGRGPFVRLRAEGSGQLYEIQGRRIGGEGLMFGPSLLHVALFPTSGQPVYTPDPVEEGPGIYRDYRR